MRRIGSVCVAVATGICLAGVYTRKANHSATMMSEAEAVDSISSIKIGKAQRDAEQTPSEPFLPPQPSGTYEVDESVRSCRVGSSSNGGLYLYFLAFPVPGTKIIHAQNYGVSLWGKTAKIVVELPSGEEKNYFLKVE